MASVFLECGCKKFDDGGVIMCPEHIHEYNLKKDRIRPPVVVRKEPDGKTSPV